MVQQYWIDDFYIDLSRNQITQNNSSKILAPKALSVLTYLAQHQGKVVSQNELLEAVWPHTIVSPNTLQRSIAQLRKALGDDGKVQAFIKTHARKGYSLECNVRWQPSEHHLSDEKPIAHNLSNAETSVPTDKKASDSLNPQKNRPPNKSSAITKQFVALAVTFMFTLTALGTIFWDDKNKHVFKLEGVQAITSTDNKEMASLYSPDGKYIIFQRYSKEGCVNNIWARNINTQQEHQLTKNIDAYGKHSFSKDGKQLVFIRTLDCDNPITQKKCYQLVSLDFTKSLQSPQPTRLLLECKNSEIKYPHWLNNNNIAMLQKKDFDRWQLISYSIKENKSKILHDVNDGNIIYFDYSPTDELIALTSVHDDGKHYVEMLKPDGQLISSHVIAYPDEIPSFKLIFASFSSINNQLIFSTGRQLFTLSHEGQVSSIALPLDEPIWSLAFHPNKNKALAIKGVYDSDIALLSLPTIAKVNNKDPEPNILARSIVADGNATVQPNGRIIAFKTARSGEDQVWLVDGQAVRQLTHFPMDTKIYSIEWSIDGQSLLVNVNHTLTQVFLEPNKNTTQKAYSLPYPVAELLTWNSQNNTALSLIRIKGILKLAEINLTNLNIQVLRDNKVNWAQKSDEGQLIYTDHMDIFWRQGAVEDEHITLLDGQLADNQRFLVREKTIYGFNNKFELWSYNLEKDIFTVIAQLPSNVDYISDIDSTKLLITMRITANKKVVELSLSGGS